MRDKERLFEFIENHKDGMKELQALLSSVPAIAPQSGGDGEWDKAQAFIPWLKNMGFRTIEMFAAPDPRVPSGKRPNIMTTVPGKSDDATFWIMSHLDVVPPGEMGLWDTDPYKVVEKDGRLYGRGVEDNQQGLVASVFAALAFLKTGVIPARRVGLLFVADEETASDYGIKYLLREHRLFGKNDLFLVPDSGLPDGTMIEVAEKTLLWMKFVTKGMQCHASRPDQGRNAFVAASELVLKLDSLKQSYARIDPIFEPPYSTFEPTKKEANVPNVNTIPGEDVFYLDSRILPSIPTDDVLSTIDRHCRDIEKKYGVSVSYEIIQRVESVPTPADAGLVVALKKAVKNVYGVDARPVGIGGGTVGAFLRNAGYPVAIWAKFDETAHQPNEYCIVENMVGDAKVMAELMLGT